MKIRLDNPKTLAVLAKLDAMPLAERQAYLRAREPSALLVTTPQDGLPGAWEVPINLNDLYGLPVTDPPYGLHINHRPKG